MRKSISILVTLLLSATAMAQQTVEQKSSLEERVERLEERLQVSDYLKISGFIQAAYNWDDEGTSTFKLRRARLSLKGDVYQGKRGAKIDYHLQVNFTDTPKIVDLWLRYRPFKALGVQVGQFKTPTMYELTEFSQPTLEFIEFALATRRLQRMGSDDITGISSSGRDMGMQLYGDLIERDGFSVFSYNLAVINGSGINTADTNSSKDLIARLIARPSKGLAFSGFYSYGEANFSDSPQLERFGWAGNPQYVEMQRYGVGANYRGRHLFARTEYIQARTGELLSEGAYFAMGWHFDDRSSIAARWDYLDENVDTRPHEMNYTISATYKPLSMLRLQLNYVRKQYEGMEQRGANAVLAMATLQF